MLHNSGYGEDFNSDSECTAGQGIPIRENTDKKIQGTIDSTVRTIQRVEQGILTEEDLEKCLETNSQNIGISVEELKTLAQKQIEEETT